MAYQYCSSLHGINAWHRLTTCCHRRKRPSKDSDNPPLFDRSEILRASRYPSNSGSEISSKSNYVTPDPTVTIDDFSKKQFQKKLEKDKEKNPVLHRPCEKGDYIESVNTLNYVTPTQTRTLKENLENSTNTNAKLTNSLSQVDLDFDNKTLRTQDNLSNNLAIDQDTEIDSSSSTSSSRSSSIRSSNFMKRKDQEKYEKFTFTRSHEHYFQPESNAIETRSQNSKSNLFSSHYDRITSEMADEKEIDMLHKITNAKNHLQLTLEKSPKPPSKTPTSPTEILKGSVSVFDLPHFKSQDASSMENGLTAIPTGQLLEIKKNIQEAHKALNAANKIEEQAKKAPILEEKVGYLNERLYNMERKLEIANSELAKYHNIAMNASYHFDAEGDHHFMEDEMTEEDRAVVRPSKETLKTDIENILEETVRNSTKSRNSNKKILSSRFSSEDEATSTNLTYPTNTNSSVPVDETPTKFVDIRKKFEAIIKANLDNNLGSSLSADLKLITQNTFNNQNGSYYNYSGYGGITGAQMQAAGNSFGPRSISNLEDRDVMKLRLIKEREIDAKQNNAVKVRGVFDVTHTLLRNNRQIGS